MLRTWLDFVKEEFAVRQSIDPGFSLRAFARLIGIAPSTLSCILTGQRRLTPRIAAKIAQECHMSQEKKMAFLHLAVGAGVSEIASERIDRDFRVLNDDELRRIGHWQHYAILSLAQMPDCKSDPTWIGHRLNISDADATAALSDLIELGFIRIVRHSLRRSVRSLRSSSDTPQRTRPAASRRADG